jgi:hypothetical protein
MGALACTVPGGAVRVERDMICIGSGPSLLWRYEVWGMVDGWMDGWMGIVSYGGRLEKTIVLFWFCSGSVLERDWIAFLSA